MYTFLLFHFLFSSSFLSLLPPSLFLKYSEVEVENILDKCIMLFRYLQDKVTQCFDLLINS